MISKSLTDGVLPIEPQIPVRLQPFSDDVPYRLVVVDRLKIHHGIQQGIAPCRIDRRAFHVADGKGGTSEQGRDIRAGACGCGVQFGSAPKAVAARNRGRPLRRNRRLPL